MTIIFFLILLGWPHFSTICHELGHLVCAKLVGLSPHLMKVGGGFIFTRKNFFGAQLELGILPGDGLICVTYPDTGWSKFDDLKQKLIISIIGGCLANFILLAGSITLLVYTGSPIFLYFICVEVLFIISTLVPTDVHLNGMQFPTDGKQIFHIITRDDQRRNKELLAHYREKVIRIIRGQTEPQTVFNDDLRILSLLAKADAELVYRHFDEAMTILNRLLLTEHTADFERAYILDTLASIVINHRQKQHLARADGWSQEAMKLAGYSQTIRGTRGAILIELGKYEEGKQMLFPLTEPDNDPIDIAISNYFLAKAEHRLGNSEQAWRRLKLAEEAGEQVPGLSEMFASLINELG